MFLVSDDLQSRQILIRGHLASDPFVAVLLAAADFEWTVRRAILALGKSPTKSIREGVLERCSGLDAYKEAWKIEVKARLGKGLPEVISGWQFFREQAYPLRHKLVHGVSGTTGNQYAADRVEAILKASEEVANYVDNYEKSIYGRKIIRRKPR